MPREVECVDRTGVQCVFRDKILGATRFNDLARGLPGLSRSLVAKRLGQFERAELVERIGSQYVLTDAGRELDSVVSGPGAWGARWAFGDPDPDEFDAELLVWWMHDHLDTSAFPGRRHVIDGRFRDDPQPF
jgi:DNA-binding HxlR family transcriptional regulator